jgi:micrococcal nuclease
MFKYLYRVKKINKIIDGDTVDLDIDLGFHITILKDLD